MEDKEDNKWHLDRRVNLSIIISLVSIAVVGLVSYGTLSERVNENSKQILEIKAAGGRLEDKLDSINQKLFELVGIMKERSK